MDKNKKIWKTINKAFIIGFLLMIVLPVAFFNMETGAVSENEKRLFANLPSVHATDGSFNENVRAEFSDWLGDRIGFRQSLVRTASHIKLSVLHESPSSIIHVGQNGWYYYAEQGNILIAKGQYDLTEPMLQRIAANQQAISDYYKQNDVDYYLMITPAKTSIYPEFVGVGSYTLRETPVDVVERYLAENTDVQMINPKMTLIENKDKGQLFLKQDFHWTNLGAYYAYRATIEHWNRTGLLHDVPIEVHVEDIDYGTGEVSGYFGGADFLNAEIAPSVRWRENAVQLEDGIYFKEIEAICAGAESGELIASLAVYENPKVPSGRLLIYGDSQIMPERKLPRCLSEHFSIVVNTGIRPEFNPELEAFVQPDVVIYSCSERNINASLHGIDFLSKIQ
ncbi:MAG: hypothetical protein LBN36_03990 [Clostridiales Family XIII bacterium]|nr:hypothetical protein [Clostridiales Family XIII bacterium]